MTATAVADQRGEIVNDLEARRLVCEGPACRLIRASLRKLDLHIEGCSARRVSTGSTSAQTEVMACALDLLVTQPRCTYGCSLIAPWPLMEAGCLRGFTMFINFSLPLLAIWAVRVPAMMVRDPAIAVRVGSNLVSDTYWF